MRKTRDFFQQIAKIRLFLIDLQKFNVISKEGQSGQIAQSKKSIYSHHKTA